MTGDRNMCALMTFCMAIVTVVAGWKGSKLVEISSTQLNEKKVEVAQLTVKVRSSRVVHLHPSPRACQRLRTVNAVKRQLS